MTRLLVTLLFSLLFTSLPVDANYTQLTICIIGETKTVSSVYSFDRSAAAIAMAVDHANDHLLPSSLKIVTSFTDIGSVCSDRTHIAGHFISLLHHEVTCDVVIGPGCGKAAEVLYDFLEFYNIPMIGCPSADLGTTSMITEYKKLTRVSILYETIADVLKSFFHYQHYETIAFFQDNAMSFFGEMNSFVMAHFKDQHYDLYERSRFMAFDSRRLTKERAKNMLREASQTTRVIFLGTNGPTVRRIMLAAHELGMSGGDYVFLAVELYTNPLWGRYHPIEKDDWDQAALSAYRVLLIISLRDVTTDYALSFWKQMKERSQLQHNYTFHPLETFDPIITHFYDAVVLYATAVTQLMNAGKNYRDAFTFAMHTKDFSFESPINGMVHLDEHSDRLWEYVIRIFDPRDRRYEMFLGFEPINQTTYPLGDANDWPQYGHLPPNTPRCGFMGEYQICRHSYVMYSRYVVAITLPIALLVVFSSAAICVAIKIRKMRALAHFTWWINKDQLKEIMNGNAFSSAGFSVKSAMTMQSRSTAFIEDAQSISTTRIHNKKLAMFGGEVVQLDALDQPLQRPNFKIRKEVFKVAQLQHQNLQNFIGILMSDRNCCEAVLGEYCGRGSLHGLLGEEGSDVTWEFRFSFLRDLITGMVYLHQSSIRSHGRLTPHTCLIDNRFVLKISQYGLPSLISPTFLEPPDENTPQAEWQKYLWRAPEFLNGNMPPCGSQKGDIYSFAIIVHQIILRCAPFRLTENEIDGNDLVTAKEVVLEIKRGGITPLRPLLTNVSMPAELIPKLETYWHEDPDKRPTFTRIRSQLGRLVTRSTDNLVDNLVLKMERYAIGLEKKIQDKIALFMEEKERSATLLEHILPKPVAAALVAGQFVAPELFSDVSVYFGDIPAFDKLVGSSATTPYEYIYFLNNLYTIYDSVIENYDVYKIECLIDAYLIVSGLPKRNGDSHVPEIVKMSLELLKCVGEVRFGLTVQKSVALRIGIHTGPCVAGIIGAKLPKYCIFGDTVNVASRMQTTGEEGKIQCSKATNTHLQRLEQQFVQPTLRGDIFVKGKGMLQSYWLKPFVLAD